MPNPRPTLKKLPAVSRMTREVKVRHVVAAVEHILAKRKDLAKLDFFEDLWWPEANANDQTLSALATSLSRISTKIQQVLWRHNLFIARTAIDEFLFDASRDSTVDDPVGRVFEIVRDFGLHRPGFVLYPVHSFGLLRAGLHLFGGASRPVFQAIDGTSIITAQTNSHTLSVSFLRECKKVFGIDGTLPEGLITHFRHSRGLRWFEANPLLAVRITTFSKGYYENEWVLRHKLSYATTYFFMLSALGEARSGPNADFLFSSSRFNNWQTLDIEHYLVFQSPVHGTELDLRCVPMNVSRVELVELADLSLELEPVEWSRRRSLATKLLDALRKIDSVVIASRFGRRRKAKGQACEKMDLALKYFRRSFRTSTSDGDRVIALAMAFELMLTDSYAPGVTRRIHRRLKLVCRGMKGTRSFQNAVRRLFEARGALLHQGVNLDEVRLNTCRRAFVRAFMVLATRVDGLQPRDPTPMRSLTRDTSGMGNRDA